MISLIAALSISQVVPPAPQTKRNISLVPIVSGQRLEDIQESKDGTRLLTHDRGFAPRLWDPRNMKILRILGGQQDRVEVVRFSPDGSWIVTVAGAEAKVWDSRFAKTRFTYKAPAGSLFTAATFSATGDQVALGTNKGLFGIAKTAEGSPAPTFIPIHAAKVEDLNFSPDGKSIVSASADKTAKIWTIGKPTPTFTLSGHLMPIRWARYSSDGKNVLTTSLDKTAKLWSATKGKMLFSHAHAIGEKGMLVVTEMAALFVGKADSTVLFANESGTMELFERATLKPAGALKGHEGPVREIRRSLDGLSVATYGTDEELKIWDVVGQKELPFTRPAISPTAGEFSPNNDVFWLGYTDGSIRRHNIRTGAIQTTTSGAMDAIEKVRILPSGRIIFQYPATGGFGARPMDTIRAIDNPSTGYRLGSPEHEPVVSPDGKRAITFTGPDSSIFYWNFETLKRIAKSPADVRGAAFSADSTRAVVWFEKGLVGIYSMADPAFVDVIDAQSFKDTKEGIVDIGLNHDGTIAVSAGHDGDATHLWKIDEGETFAQLPKLTDPFARVGFTPEDKYVYALSYGKLHFCSPKTGAIIRTIVIGRANSAAGIRPSFSADGKQVGLVSQEVTGVWEVETGKPLYLESTADAEYESAKDNSRWDPIKGRLLRVKNRTFEVFDYRAQKVLASARLEDQPNQVQFLAGTDRVVTLDPIDGMNVWLLTGNSLEKQGTFFTTVSAGWLARDPAGRYDADDPNSVEGASYVLEWRDGLEPVEVGQFKSQFYEPDLLSRILGLSKEPPREVPDLSSLRLYPEVKITKGKGPMNLEITVEDRDEGGIGKVNVFVNGKQVVSKKGTGFLAFDAQSYSQYFLPETLLNGAGNQISVVATNAAGDLSSAPVVVDIGVPADLKTPEIHLYAICVGVGDYVGNTKDLQATPKDAESLAGAIEQVGGRLLPGKIEVTTLSTGGKNPKPTKSNILNWFKETTAKATSSDIVLVFLAGHGTASIGSKQDYFFLTAEADPSDLNEAAASTSAISGEELRTLLAGMPAGKQVVILDTCHSGAATNKVIGNDRSVSGDYRRAWEGIRDASGTWLLAGTAADQLSYESANVEHGMLTYALLEAIDKANADGLRPGSTEGEFFVDVEQWLNYAANRVESLKNEVGIKGVQRPELRRSRSNTSFDIGVTKAANRGAIGLKSPKPVVLLGDFSLEEEDPLELEKELAKGLADLKSVKAWFDVPKHPMAYRVTGTYEVAADVVKVKVVLQKFDAFSTRRTIETFVVEGSKRDLAPTISAIVKGVDERIAKVEAERGK